MTAPINFSGLGSGVQWNDIVDTTIKAMEARTVKPISDRIALREKQKEAWTRLRGLVDSMNNAALGVRRVGFGGFTAAAPASPTTGRSLLSVSPGASATPGRYRVEVLQVADTAKLGGGSVSDVSAARNLSGTFKVNGADITLASSDSLTAIRDKVNAANAGVTATIISEGGTGGRLVLTSTSAGAGGIDITDGAAGLGRELGFLDSRSRPVSSATAAAAAAMGMSLYPQPASIRVGGVTITADLATESIAAIAAKINAAGGSASIEAEAYGNETRYRLVTDGNITAIEGDANSAAIVEALGMGTGTTGSVRQSVQSAAFSDAGGGPATTATALTALQADGTAPGLSVGDAINIRGTRGDGTAVTYGLVVQAGDTVQTLLDRINDVASGFGAGSRRAEAALGSDGRIRLIDETGGPSRLSLSLSLTRADGTSGSLGATTLGTVGRNRELQQGRDAIVRVDGQEFVRNTNALTDVLSGTTINLQQAEPGTSIDVEIARDTQGATAAVKTLVDAYNELRKFFDEQRAAGAPLSADSTLRTMMQSFTGALRTEASANGTYNRAVNVGLVLDRDGRLTFNETRFRTAFAEKPGEVESLLGATGVGGAFVKITDDVNRFGVGPVSVSINSITSNVISLRSRETEATRRLEERRLQLVQRYTAMEEAMSKLQSQSNSLIASVQGLQGNNR